MVAVVKVDLPPQYGDCAPGSPAPSYRSDMAPASPAPSYRSNVVDLPKEKKGDTLTEKLKQKLSSEVISDSNTDTEEPAAVHETVKEEKTEPKA